MSKSSKKNFSESLKRGGLDSLISSPSKQPEEKLVRLTIAIPLELHKAYKIYCTNNSLKQGALGLKLIEDFLTKENGE